MSLPKLKSIFVALTLLFFLRSGLCGGNCGTDSKCTCGNFIMDCRNQSQTSFPETISADIKAVHLSNNKLTTLKQLPEKSELQTLDLSNNLIKNMSYDAFDNLDNLQTLMLSYNKISSIVDDIFEWNPLKLQVLHLDHNDMEFIQHFLFYDLEQLSELHLQNNKITFIHPHAFLQLKNLRRLRLDGNKLHTFQSKWINKLQSNNFEELRFDDNPWSCDCAMESGQKWLLSKKKSEWFKGLTEAHPIECATPIALIGKNVTEVKNIKDICDKPVITGISSPSTIDVGRDVLLRCQFANNKYPVPTISWTAPNGDVFRLNTADNFEGVTVHQDGSLLIENLKKADSGTYTCNATNNLGSFSANTKLTITDKKGDGSQMDKLVVSASAPQDTNHAVNTAFCPEHCTCISRHVDCGGDGNNPLNALPSKLPPDAVSIGFGMNALSTIEPDDFAKFKDLEELRLDKNQISVIHPKAFFGLKRLGTLTLRENKITDIKSGTFDTLTKLNVLVLDKNLLSKLQDYTFEGLSSVQWLYIRDNRIQTISNDAFKPLKKIKFIHLEGNQIQVMYPETISVLTSATPPSNIQKIFVDDNSFNCDCHMKNMRSFISNDLPKQYNDIFADGIKCSFPTKHIDEYLKNVEIKDLICTDITEKWVIPDITQTTHITETIGLGNNSKPETVTVAVPVSTGVPSGLLFGGVILGIVLTIVGFIAWRKWGRRARTGGRSYNYSNLNGVNEESKALTSEGLASSGTEAFV